MDDLTCIPTTWRNAPALLIIGDTLEVVLSLRGGHLAALRLRGEALNPLWQPPWPGADPATVVPGASGTYGDGPEAFLLAGIVGSNLCCDRFGSPWPGERRPLHGEAGVATYRRIATAATVLSIEAYLPEARLWVARAISLDGANCLLRTTVRHQGQHDRAIEWCEHTNLGDPFLDGCAITADVDAAFNLPGSPEPAFAHYPPLGAIPLAVALPVPQADAPASGAFAACRVQGAGLATWSAVNRRLRRRLTATFSAAAFPWLGLWTQHRSRQTPPWSGVTRVRGMELSTKPFPEGKPPALRTRHFQGRSTQCLVPPGPGLEKAIRFTWERLAG